VREHETRCVNVVDIVGVVKGRVNLKGFGGKVLLGVLLMVLSKTEGKRKCRERLSCHVRLWSLFKKEARIGKGPTRTSHGENSPLANAIIVVA